jgi:hypothetical protein
MIIGLRKIVLSGVSMLVMGKMTYAWSMQVPDNADHRLLDLVTWINRPCLEETVVKVGEHDNKACWSRLCLSGSSKVLTGERRYS